MNLSEYKKATEHFPVEGGSFNEHLDNRISHSEQNWTIALAGGCRKPDAVEEQGLRPMDQLGWLSRQNTG